MPLPFCCSAGRLQSICCAGATSARPANRDVRLQQLRWHSMTIDRLDDPMDLRSHAKPQCAGDAIDAVQAEQDGSPAAQAEAGPTILRGDREPWRFCFSPQVLPPCPGCGEPPSYTPSEECFEVLPGCPRRVLDGRGKPLQMSSHSARSHHSLRGLNPISCHVCPFQGHISLSISWIWVSMKR